MRLRTLWPAAIVAAALAAPVGITLAAAKPAPSASAVSPSLHAPLAGHATASSAMRDAGRGRLARQHLTLARRYDALTGRHTARRAERRALRLRPARLRALNRELRGAVNELDIPIPAVLKQVAECESHNDPKAIGGGGSFRGAFQFMEIDVGRSRRTGRPRRGAAEGAVPPRGDPHGPLGLLALAGLRRVTEGQTP